MDHRTRRLLLVVGGSLTVSFGLLVACNNDDQFLRLPQATNNIAEASVDPAAGGDAGDAGVDDAGCSIVRSSPRVYCFGARSLDDAGSGCAPAALDASSPEICCADEIVSGTRTPPKCVATTASASGYATGQCGFSTAPDAGGREWHCLAPQHCPDEASQCCVIAGWKDKPSALKDNKAPAVCNQLYSSASAPFVNGTRCRTTCNQGELLLCSSNDDCGDGTTCKFFTLGQFFTGVCQ